MSNQPLISLTCSDFVPNFFRVPFRSIKYPEFSRLKQNDFFVILEWGSTGLYFLNLAFDVSIFFIENFFPTRCVLPNIRVGFDYSSVKIQSSRRKIIFKSRGSLEKKN